jgi:ubiquinone biosynthesis protein
MLSIRKIGVMRRGYRHLNRYRQILTILIKYGFGDLLDTLKIEQYLETGLQMISSKRRERVERFSRAERVRMAMEELGPTFVKLAPLEEIFQTFEEMPLAAASIGQVHRARLKDGEDVVVKVQRPGIGKTVEVDLEIMLHLASLMERHLEEAKIHRPTRIVDEFARTIEKEIDYAVEASYIERFARQFQGDMSVYVPKVFHEASTERVLTTEFIDGIKASEIDRIDEEGLDRKMICARGADLILKQIFDHGFFHADPHPGNIYVLANNVICYLDYGMMGHIDRKTRENFAALVYGVGRWDESSTMQALLKLTDYDEEPDLRNLQRDIADFMGQYLYKPLKDLQIGKLLQQLLELISRHRLRLPPNLFLMIKALTTVEGVGLSLDPDFDMMERTAPFIKRIRTARMHPKRIADDVLEFGIDLVYLLRDVPGELREILMQLKQGKVKMQLEHGGPESMLSTQNQISNRIAFSIVIAALIIGSALIILSKTPPYLHGIPLIGIIGFVAAAVMGVWLLIAILRNGRL